MKIEIGPYIEYFGPYQLAARILFWRDSESTAVNELGAWFDERRCVTRWLEGLHAWRKRNVQIKLHNFDTWNADTTLSLIIVPMLQQLKATKQGSPKVADEDVPGHLRSTAAGPHDPYDVDELWHDRWTWVLDEMIWAFKQSADSNSDEQFFKLSGDGVRVDSDGLDAYTARKDNGRRLFAKYFECLWD